jgi:hypothetical protein
MRISEDRSITQKLPLRREGGVVVEEPLERAAMEASAF